jgi:steroid 5-alpha reductase family enzyme
MSILATYVFGGLVILVLMIALWLLSLRLKDASIIDPAWGTGFVILVWIYFINTPEGFGPRKWLLAVLVTLWGLRLSVFLFLRNRRKGEDPRYAKWRKEAGARWWWQSLFKVFLLQGVLMWIISMPLFFAQASQAPYGPMDSAAFLLWLVGFFFEAVGDWQLARFKALPANKGKVMDSGLWRYTRHPNYFGEAMMWWAYGFFALASGAWSVLASPLLMNWLLLKISGVTLLEKNLKNSKPKYAAYIKRTSPFIPLPPKKG